MAIDGTAIVTRKYWDSDKFVEVKLTVRDAILFELLKQISMRLKSG